MKINLAKSAGFCFGVKRAITIALETAKSETNVYMLGDIVHNENVVKQIELSGIKKINTLKEDKGQILLIRAHGTDTNTVNRAMKLGYKIIDATCPMVKEIHKIARDMEQKGYMIIVIGDTDHDEVRGIIGQLKTKSLVVENLQTLPLDKIRKIKKAAVVVQSTQNLDKVTKIVDVLKTYIKDLEFFNTICRPTRIKQGEIQLMPSQNDVMVIIGSKNSANTNRLFDISKSINPKSYWINSAKEIKSWWFKDAKTVGITAGASTPESTIQEVVKHISVIRPLN